jgi:transposase
MDLEEIATLIAADPLWTQLDREFRSIKGVATRTVAPLMAGMPEIGTLSNNPRAVRRFAEGMGLTEKTDAIDAGLIAWFAEVKRSTSCPPPSPHQQMVLVWRSTRVSSSSHRRALVTRLRQLTQLRTAQRNQRRLRSLG